MTGYPHDFRPTPLHQPAGELRAGEEPLGNDHGDFTRTIAQHEPALFVEEIRRRDQFTGHAHELARVTFAEQIRRQYIAGFRQSAPAQTPDFNQHQLFHAVVLGEFSARLDDVAALEAAAKQRGVAREQHQGARVVLQVDERRIFRGVGPESAKVNGVGDEYARDRERFAETVGNKIAILVAQDFLNRGDSFRGSRGRDRACGHRETEQEQAPCRSPVRGSRFPSQNAERTGKATPRSPPG